MGFGDWRARTWRAAVAVAAVATVALGLSSAQAVTVESLSPDHGPTAGGTEVALEGAGFSAAAIYSGYRNSLLVTDDGTPYWWSDWTRMQQDPIVPLDTSGVLHGKTIVDAVGAYGTFLVLTSDNKLVTWGDGRFGQLGNGTMPASDATSPVAVDMSGALAGKTIAGIAGGDYAFAVWTTDGRAYTWGGGVYGRLGIGTQTESAVPVPLDMTGVLAGEQVVAISGMDAHFVALTRSNKLVSWGNNTSGVLGNGTTNGDALVPVAVDMTGVLAGKQIAEIGAGQDFVVVRTSDGELFAWGSNLHKTLGNGGPDSPVPVAVDMSGVLAGKKATSLHVGSSGVVVRADDDKLYSWGYSSYGGLGTGTTAYSPVPVEVNLSGVPAGVTFTHIAGSLNYFLATGSDGLLYGWGSNDMGQLTVSPSKILKPTELPFPNVSVTFGGVPAAAIVRNGATGYTVTTPAHASGAVDVVVTVNGVSVTLKDGFTYGAAPVVTQQPQSVQVEESDLGSTVSFSAQASGDETPTVQWQVSTDGGTTWASIDGATMTTLDVTATEDAIGNAYRAVFTNGLGSATTDAAKLTLRGGGSTGTPTETASASPTETATPGPTETAATQGPTESGSGTSTVPVAGDSTPSVTTSSGSWLASTGATIVPIALAALAALAAGMAIVLRRRARDA